MAGFGGIYRLVSMYMAIVVGYINSKVMMAKLIRNMYFLKKPNTLAGAFTLTNNKFFKKLQTIKVDYFNYCFKYSRNRKEKTIDKKKVYEKGAAKVS